MAGPCGGTTDVHGAIDEKVLGRVRALLAKAESTNFEEEADALIAKAQELMARHSIDVAMLAHERRNTADSPVAQRVHLDDPYLEEKSFLLHVVATANRSTAVFNPHLAFVTVMGFETDIAIVDVLFTSLLSQATVSLRSAGIGGGTAASRRTPSFRRSFLLSYASRIRERLHEGAAAAGYHAGRIAADQAVLGAGGVVTSGR